MALSRLVLRCIACGDTVLAWDARLGLTGYFSPQARRLVCLAGVSWPFGKAQDHLHEFSGLRVSAEAIRQASHGEAVTLAAWRAEAAEAVADFQAASGDIEFQTDAGKVNTTAGWKDMKIGIFAKRPRGLPAPPSTGPRGICPRRLAGMPSPPLRRAASSAPDHQRRLSDHIDFPEHRSGRHSQPSWAWLLMYASADSRWASS